MGGVCAKVAAENPTGRQVRFSHRGGPKMGSRKGEKVGRKQPRLIPLHTLECEKSDRERGKPSKEKPKAKPGMRRRKKKKRRIQK